MNPYDEHRLREEVIYLHSLWHQGPPRKPIQPPSPKRINTSHNLSRNLHKPTNTTPFKREKTTNKTEKKIFKKQNNVKSEAGSDSHPGNDSGPKWPVNPTRSPPAATGWAEVKPQRQSKSGPLSVEEEAKILAMRIQHKGLEACRDFFSRMVEIDEEDYQEEGFGEEDYLTENDWVGGSEEYKFLLEIFVKDDNLRVYYEKKNEDGDFCCLVCAGIGKKVNKRFKDCVGLVQHAISISKTTRKRAHRAFGQVVCRVLGWDIGRLPVIVLKGEPLGKSLMNSVVTQSEVAIGNAEENEDVTVVENNEGSVTVNIGEMVKKGVSNDNPNADELMICEVDDVGKCVENLDGKFLNMEADTNLAVDCQVDDVRQCVENLHSEVLNLEADKDVAVDCLESGPSLVTSTEWSCINPVDEFSMIASGWPTLKTRPPLVIVSASAEEQAKLVAVQLQKKVSEACQEFFEKSANSDGSASDGEDDNDLMDEDGSEESEEFKFFLKVFIENDELRRYYEKNYGCGEFCCLVCGGIGKKVWKRFKDCLALIQHSTAISKTKKKRAHRAFGQVICKVLGWNIGRLPSVVLKGETLSHSLAKLAEVEADADGDKDDLSAVKNIADCEPAQKEDLALLICKNSTNGDDTNKNVNDVYEGILDMEGNKGGVVDVLVDDR